MRRHVDTPPGPEKRGAEGTAVVINAPLARERVETDMKLAIIGDSPYAAEYIAKVRDTRDPRIVIPGAIYGQGYRELQSHCFAYIHATEVGGTHPALIESMGRGALTLYLYTAENHEVANSVGFPFERDTLADTIRRVIGMPDVSDARMQSSATCASISRNT